MSLSDAKVRKVQLGDGQVYDIEDAAAQLLLTAHETRLTAAETKLGAIYNNANYYNQNAFGIVKFGDIQIQSDNFSDVLNIAAGDNIQIDADPETDSIVFSAKVYDVVSKEDDGLVPQLPDESTTTKYLRQDGSWHVPPNTTYTSKAAAAGGTGLSLVTTGEKYAWNQKASTAVATTSSNGLMSAADKAKLTNLGLATTSANGLMSASDKSKLNNIANGAEVNVNAYSRFNISTASGTTQLPAVTKSDTFNFLPGNNISLAVSNGVKGVVINADYPNLTPVENSPAVSVVTAGDKWRWDHKTGIVIGTINADADVTIEAGANGIIYFTDNDMLSNPVIAVPEIVLQKPVGGKTNLPIISYSKGTASNLRAIFVTVYNPTNEAITVGAAHSWVKVSYTKY